MQSMKVGHTDKKDVSSLNNELFLSARKIIKGRTEGTENNPWHIGWKGVGSFIDWLEQNYNIEKKDT